ncbi:MAG: M48 family metallopeptidase, partial [Methylobacteriaceae bacterium]|nr:M48 family metallopeptidase [Methylobacteriaceae bacterium]
MSSFGSRDVKLRNEPDSLEVTLPDGVIRVKLKRRRTRKGMILRLSKTSREAQLTLPPGMPLNEALCYLAGQGAAWLHSTLSKLPRAQPFVEDALIPVRGVEHRIVRREGRGVVHVETTTDPPLLVVHSAPEHVGRRIREYLVREAARDLREAVTRHTASIGKTARRISVKDTISRWGSCSAGGNLSFSWRLVLAPPFVLDYLAAHEVAHLEEMNHSRQFWSITRRLCPDTGRAEVW